MRHFLTFTQEQATKFWGGGKYRYSCTLPLTSALGGMGGQRHALAALPREEPGTHCIGGWVAPGPVWTGAENLASTGIQPPDRPASSESLYRLSYPGPLFCIFSAPKPKGLQ